MFDLQPCVDFHEVKLTACIEKELKEFHREELGRLLTAAGADAKVDEFKRYGSARRLYNFNIDHAGEY